MYPFLTKKFPLAYTIGIAILVGGITFGVTYLLEVETKSKTIADNLSVHQCTYDVKRIGGYDYIKPIIFVDELCESEDLTSIKYSVNKIVETYKASGDVNSASIYLRAQGEWMTVNGNEKYEPGSLFKVPIMMAILKMSEENPGYLDKQVVFTKPLMELNKKVNFKASKTLKKGEVYTLRELLTYMIKYSDNNATMLLETYMDPKVLTKLFTDLGLQAPDINAEKYFFGVKEYSTFMRAIYNAGYLNISNSEYAAELLGTCEFNNGIANGIPKGVKLAHKFGESGSDAEVQLHESGIIYLNQKPYLLTVMSKGKDFGKLSKMLTEISVAVYNEMKGRATAI